MRLFAALRAARRRVLRLGQRGVLRVGPAEPGQSGTVCHCDRTAAQMASMPTKVRSGLVSHTASGVQTDIHRPCPGGPLRRSSHAPAGAGRALPPPAQAAGTGPLSASRRQVNRRSNAARTAAVSQTSQSEDGMIKVGCPLLLQIGRYVALRRADCGGSRLRSRRHLCAAGDFARRYVRLDGGLRVRAAGSPGPSGAAAVLRRCGWGSRGRTVSGGWPG
jgi:hypothetical protein